MIVDMATSKRLPEDHPVTIAVMALWDGLTEGQRQAWHAVTCLNSREPYDMLAVRRFVDDMGGIVERHFGKGPRT